MGPPIKSSRDEGLGLQVSERRVWGFWSLGFWVCGRGLRGCGKGVECKKSLRCAGQMDDASVFRDEEFGISGFRVFPP